MSEERTHHITVSLDRNYEFVAQFPDVPASSPVRLDEPAPLGENRAPNAAALVGAAVGNCLAASLTFCLRKSRIAVDGLSAHVTTHVTKNEHGKFRISGIDVELEPDVNAVEAAKLVRCEQLFEDFCIVTQSVRQGIPVNVTIKEPATVGSAT